VATLADTTPEARPDVDMMLSFLGGVSPQRGIVR
jgi:UDP-N-acetylglucosamine acyltransferase